MEKRKRNISFIIPAYNSEKTLAETIDSVYDNNFENGDEIIIIDDASTDGTLRLAEDMQKKYPSIKIVHHHINKGTAAAGRNTGIDFSVNDLIFTLDSDNILVRGSIAPLKKHMEEHGADAAAFGELRFFKEKKEKITHSWVFENKITMAYCLSRQNNPLWSGNYLFTKKSWKTAGRYFEPSLENQTIDSWAFGIRQLGTGAKFISLPGTYYYHRYGHESHYIREHKNGNASISALVALMPFLNQIKNNDVEYIFGRGRTKWLSMIEKHPIKLKSASDKKIEIVSNTIKQTIIKIIRKAYALINLHRK